MNYKTKEEVRARVQEHYDWAVGADCMEANFKSYLEKKNG